MKGAWSWLAVLVGAALALAACTSGPGASDAGPDAKVPSSKMDAKNDGGAETERPDAVAPANTSDADDDGDAVASAPDGSDAEFDGGTGTADAVEAAPCPSMIDLGVLGEDQGSSGVAVNDQGDVAASSGGLFSAWPTGFYYRDGRARYLPPTRDVRSCERDLMGNCVLNSQPSAIPGAINAAGDIVGQTIPSDVYPAVYNWQSRAGPAALWRHGAALETVPPISVTELAVNPPASSVATAINESGQVIGSTQTCGRSTCAPLFVRTRAFFWEPNLKRARDLGTLRGPDLDGSGLETIAWALNAHGQVVGDSRTPGAAPPSLPTLGPMHAFLWEAGSGTMKDLGTLGGMASSARAISDDGVVFGLSDTASGASHVFRWENGAMQDLGVAPAGIVAMSPPGRILGNSGNHAYIWEAGQTRDLGTLGGANTTAAAMNVAGQVVGASATATGETHAFVWTDGVMRDLGTLGGVGSRATAISLSGKLVVGASKTSAGAEHAFLWTEQRTCPPPPPAPPPADVPRLLFPPSTSTLTTKRPLMRWRLPADADGAHVRICRDRGCATEVASFDATGSSGSPAADLPSGVLFWRASWRRAGVTGAASSPTWAFRAPPRSAAATTAWGTMSDFNGDGYEDILVKGNAAGYVYAGGSSTLGPSPTTTIGPDPGDVLGPIASAGDVNGDGYADALVVSTFYNRLYLYTGGATGLSATPSSTVESPFVSSGTAYAFGPDLGAAGDVNGDGYGDVIVGAQLTGKAFLYLGGPEGLSAARLTILVGPDDPPHAGVPVPRGNFGIYVVGAGDVNGDGFGDVAIGGNSFADGVGRVLVYLGGAGGLATTPAVTLQDPAHPYPAAIAGGGDVDGDGKADVVVSLNTSSGSSVAIHKGGDTGFSLVFGSSGYGYGWIAFRDFDGDGLADVATPGSGNSLQVWPGNPMGPQAPVVVATSAQVSSATAGDWTGDGISDLAVLPTLNAIPQQVVIHRGSAGGLLAPTDPAIVLPTPP